MSSHRLEWARDVGVDVNAEEPEGDFVGVRKAMEATAGVTISWCLSDWTFENGPIRQIPGSVRSPRPSLAAPEIRSDSECRLCTAHFDAADSVAGGGASVDESLNPGRRSRGRRHPSRQPLLARRHAK